MYRSLILAPVAVATAIVLAASAHAFPSCCQAGGSVSSTKAYLPAQNGIQAPNGPAQVLQAVRLSVPSPRATQSSRNTPPVELGRYTDIRPVHAATRSCCSVSDTAAQPINEPLRPHGGCCCGRYASTDLPGSCCGRAPVGYSLPGAHPFRSVDGAVSRSGSATRKRIATVRAIPAILLQHPCSLGLPTTGAGAFGRPAYFPGSPDLNNPR
jgi:hypothetical protein